jgi:pimeloyl-ACP methyl ester carboxylesterase
MYHCINDRILHRHVRRAWHALWLTLALLAAPTMAAAQTKQYTVTAPDGVSLAVQESGSPDGPAIVFVHGLLGTRMNWDAQTASTRLQRYRMITYDLRGHGQSGKPTDAASYAEGRRWADDLAEVIEASGAQKPVLVGWSLGAAVISNYLAKYGDDAIAGAVYVNGVVELKPDLIVAHPQIYQDMVSPDLRTHLDAMRDFLRLCFQTQPDAALFERAFAAAAMVSRDMQRAVMSMTVEAADGLGRAKVPVLLLYGARDALIHTPAAIARAKVLNRGIHSKVYAASGHAPFIEEPDRFNGDLAGFMETVGRRLAAMAR